MERWKTIDLNPALREYVRDCLSKGHSLARFLLQRQDLQAGNICTFIPHELDVTKEAMNDPRSGRLFPPISPERHEKVSGGVFVPIEHTSTILADVVQAFLQTSTQHVCIFEDAMAKPSDPSMLSRDLPWVAYNEEVYYFLPSGVDHATTMKAISYAFDFYPGLIGAMTSVSNGETRKHDKQAITEHQLETFAARTIQIVVSAYHGEGYIIWTQEKKK